MAIAYNGAVVTGAPTTTSPTVITGDPVTSAVITGSPPADLVADYEANAALYAALGKNPPPHYDETIPGQVTVYSYADPTVGVTYVEPQGHTIFTPTPSAGSPVTPTAVLDVETGARYEAEVVQTPAGLTVLPVTPTPATVSPVTNKIDPSLVMTVPVDTTVPFWDSMTNVVTNVNQGEDIFTSLSTAFPALSGILNFGRALFGFFQGNGDTDAMPALVTRLLAGKRA